MFIWKASNLTGGGYRFPRTLPVKLFHPPFTRGKDSKKQKTKTMIRKAKPLTRATQQLKVRIVLTFKKA